MQTEKTRHSRYHIFYHIVWIPKYRKASLDSPAKERIEGILKEIADDKGINVEAVEVMPDHIHLFISSPPQHSPSLLVNWFKGISSRLYNHRYQEDYVRWTSGYYVGTAGTVTKETIEKYIAEQTQCRDTSAELRGLAQI